MASFAGVLGGESKVCNGVKLPKTQDGRTTFVVSALKGLKSPKSKTLLFSLKLNTFSFNNIKIPCSYPQPPLLFIP